MQNKSFQLFNLKDEQALEDAQHQLSLILDNLTKYSLLQMKVNTSEIGEADLQLEWIDNTELDDYDKIKQNVYCEIFNMREEAEEISDKLTEAHNMRIEILERKEWQTKFGESLMVMIWREN